MFLTWINIVTAWVSTLLGVLCVIIWAMRVYIHRASKHGNLQLKAWNRLLRKHHKHIGWALVASGLIHGILSSQKLLSVNLGSLLWLSSLLLGISFLVRKRLKNPCWMTWHKGITLAFALLIVLHLIDVGISIDDYVAYAISDTRNSRQQTLQSTSTPVLTKHLSPMITTAGPQ